MVEDTGCGQPAGMKMLINSWKACGRSGAKSKNCDVTGMQSLDAIMRMAIQRKKVDGGIFFIKRYVAGGLLPFKLQMLEVDELDTVNTILSIRK